MRVTASGFGAMAGLVVEGARRWCGGRVAAVLEGGYDLAALADSVAATIEATTGEAVERREPSAPVPEAPYAVIRSRVREMRSIAGHYWKL
jgi:acetoin utilization deacetylase AcuC-like enzyme